MLEPRSEPADEPSVAPAAPWLQRCTNIRALPTPLRYIQRRPIDQTARGLCARVYSSVSFSPSESPTNCTSPVSMVSVPDAAMTRTKEAAPFLKSLRRMLDTESEAVLRWTSDGRAFEIHDLEALTAHVLPKYFKHSKYTSFQRQLNYFNFRKWTKSRASVCTFSNTYFVRDDPELAWHISRKKSSPSSPNKPALSKTTARAKNIHIAISVPSRGSSGRSLFPFPSPTDVATTQGRDQESQFSESCWFSRNDMKLEPTVAPASLDWVDTLYPSLDIVSRYAEIPEFYSDYAAASRDGQASIMQF